MITRGLRSRRIVTMMICTLMTAAVLTIGNTGPAAADDCKPSSVPDQAGSGLPGLIDDKTTSEDPETKYGNYGWSGLKWTTCDLDKNKVGVPTTDSAVAVLDTAVGNAGLGFGAVLGALMTQLHQWATDPGSILAPIDDLLSDITKAVKKATWTPWVGAVIVVAAIGVILNAFRGEVRSALKTTAAVLLACLAVAWFSTPVTAADGDLICDPKTGECSVPEKDIPGAVYAATMFDGVASGIVAGVDKSVTEVNDNGLGGSPDEARGATMQDQVLFKIWARGELGSDQAAKKYGADLYRFGTARWSDSEVDPEAKRDDYNSKAQEIKKTDPQAYDTIRGIKGGRTGFGALAAVIMFCIGLIRIPAELLMIAGLLVMRILIMFGPVLALTAIVPATRPVAVAAVKVGLASVVNVAIYGVIASIHTVLVGAIATNATNLAVATILIFALTMVVFLVAKPFRSVTRLATGQQAGDALTGAGDAPGNALKGLASALSGIATSAIGNRVGNGPPRPTTDSDDDEEPQTEPTQDEPLPSPEPTTKTPKPTPDFRVPLEWRTERPALPPPPAAPATDDRTAQEPHTGPGLPGLDTQRATATNEDLAAGPEPPRALPAGDDAPERRGVAEPGGPDGPLTVGDPRPVTVPVEWELEPLELPTGEQPSELTVREQPGDLTVRPGYVTATDSSTPTGMSEDAAGSSHNSHEPPAAPLPDQIVDADDDGDMYRPPLVIDQTGQTITIHDRVIRDVTVVEQVSEGEPARITTLGPYDEPEIDEQGHLTTSSVFRPDDELVNA